MGLLLITAQGAQAQDFSYFITNGTITITAYNGPGGDVTVPSTINGIPVTAIGDGAFDGFSDPYSILGVTIGSNVTTIGRYAFAGDTNLSTLIIGPDVATIGAEAFGYCYKLATVTMGNSITNIGDRAFSNCGALTNLNIPSSVTTIGAAAFEGCYWLTNLTLPNGVISVGDHAFWNCPYSFTNLVIPETLTNIGDYAFTGCINLASISVLPLNPVFSSVDGVLYNKNQTKLVQVPAAKGPNYTIPDTVTSLGNGACSGCASLTDIAIPNGVTSIADYAFSSCTSLTNIAIPNSVTNIGNDAFYNCSALTSLNLGKGVLTVGREPFGSCYNLASINLPNGLTSIGEGAFGDCSKLTYLVIPKSVTTIERGAFTWCGLTNITIPASVTFLGGWAFQYCTSLKQAFFEGNAPTSDDLDSGVFLWCPATVYYLPGTTGWKSTYGGVPTVLWNPQMRTRDASFGVHEKGFGFNITGTTNIPLVIEASTNAAAGSWLSLQSSTLTNGLIYFSDAQWTNYPSRFYRIRSP